MIELKSTNLSFEFKFCFQQIFEPEPNF